MHKTVYYYHIITTRDLEEYLEQLGAYPEVHYKDETCPTKCIKEDTTSTTIVADIGGDDGGRGADNGRGDIPSDGLEQISQRENQQLCAGPNGVVEPTATDGSTTIRWGDGTRRRYYIDRDGHIRDATSYGRVGGVFGVGSYASNAEGCGKKVYKGPYKLIAVHTGTRKRHWHIIYVSPNKQWGYNSRLGRAIRTGHYKTSSISCISCLREYVYNGNGRQVVQDLFTEKSVKDCECAEHRCGVASKNRWTTKGYETQCSEGGASISDGEGDSFGERNTGLVDTDIQASGSEVYDEDGNGGEAGFKKRKTVRGREGDEHNECYGNGEYLCRDSDIIVHLCKNGAFTEAEAMAVFSKRPEGIKILCTKQYAEKVRTYIHIARVLVFQESIKQRFERAKTKYAETLGLEYDEENIIKLNTLLANNNIDRERFLRNTYGHFIKRGGKRNNLFFIGPPSTGKTMIMNSLVFCHYNFCRLTGLIANSSFNFSGLLHTNACLMDECKLTDNQFEQWKMLASGMDMSTDVKYKDRCDVKNCVLYTCSNYPIEMYCNVPMAAEAVMSRTITYELVKKCDMFFNLSPQCWETMWGEYNLFL